MRLEISNKAIKKLTKAQTQRISDMYSQLAKKLAKEAKLLEGKTNVSSLLRKQQLSKLQKELNQALKRLGSNLYKEISSNALDISTAVTDDMKNWVTSVGMSGVGAFENVPESIVEKVFTGKLYKGDWSLSKAIWSDVKSKQSEIQSIIAEGIAQNKSSFDIAKDLEKYVDPKAKKPWDWNKVYPNTSKKVDYNAQRLARTMVSHAYQQSVVDTTKDNPFVTGIKWRSALSHNRTCKLCEERNGTIYHKDNVPLDHPNGLCAMIPVVGDLMDVSNRIADWYEGKPDKALDKFTEYLKSK